jgi:hypothetical protein
VRPYAGTRGVFSFALTQERGSDVAIALALVESVGIALFATDSVAVHIEGGIFVRSEAREHSPVEREWSTRFSGEGMPQSQCPSSSGARR